jgi:tRNA G18 (ribose-2'-O)-methylase SpoU
MTPVRIEDADDPRIAGYRNIRDRDLARRDGLFVAEGKVVLRVLLETRRFEPVSVFVLENRLEGLADVLGRAPQSLPVYVAPSEVMDATAGFHLHRGVLALARRREPEMIADVISGLPETALVLALIGIANHDNVGGIFRNAAAFGTDAVLLDPTCCDPLYRKAIRVSVGGVLKVPYASAPDWRTLVTELGNSGFRQLALTPGGGNDIGAVARGGRTALYSLNVAAASAIALHRLSGISS